VPVITVGKIKDPETAEDVLREGRADLIALARTLIADPQWAAKARRGEADAIRPCIYTNRCRYRIQLGLRMRCDVNPDVGEAAPRNTQPLPAGTKALVGGGGPGGIEAALRLAKRRAHVTLVEREESLGGQLRFAGAVEFKRDLADYRDYLVRSLSRSDVDVVTGTEATLETVRAAGADIVVVATGSRPANGVPVAGDARVASALDVLAGRSVDGSVAVVGAGPTGCEIAALLSARGHDVTLVEQRGEIGGDITVDLLEYLRPILDANGVRVVTDCRVEAIEGDRVVTAGGRDELRADSVVLATGMEADDALVEALDDGRTPVYRIGDAREPGTLLSCTGDAARVVAAL
jgi:NADPH-dependent 2,4-dienoyl-CoA reductase/sulfur reductase-like enzyme